MLVSTRSQIEFYGHWPPIDWSTALFISRFMHLGPRRSVCSEDWPQLVFVCPRLIGPIRECCDCSALSRRTCWLQFRLGEETGFNRIDAVFSVLSRFCVGSRLSWWVCDLRWDANGWLASYIFSGPLWLECLHFVGWYESGCRLGRFHVNLSGSPRQVWAFHVFTTISGCMPGDTCIFGLSWKYHSWASMQFMLKAIRVL